MSHRPIIFSGPMVLALLAGRKTMTRRLVTSPLSKCQIGDRLWVREAAYYTIDQGTHKPAKVEGFFADGKNRYKHNFTVESRPSIHMPRWASRITLVVTGTKIERLQDISESDVQAEGFERLEGLQGPCDVEEVHRDAGRDWFSDLWVSLHGVDSWRSNPEVVAISFRVEKINIDQMQAVAA